MVRVNGWVELLPAALRAVTLTLKVQLTFGMPEISPVVLL